MAMPININGQYLLFRDSPLKPREELVLPQRIFTDKRSSARFNPSKYPVEEVTVTGQLPSGARGLTHFDRKGWTTNAVWKHGVHRKPDRDHRRQADQQPTWGELQGGRDSWRK